jgi:tripartite-type tricarboxylate transporter receptor subunit TctC
MLLGMVVIGLSVVAARDVPAAETFPSRPVRMIVPFPPGGITDTLGRLTGQALSEVVGQPVVADNRPGANGAIGTELAVNAAPDGYTILLGAASTQVLNPLLRKFAYDPLRALTPIGMVAETALVLVVNPDLPIKTVGELNGWLRQHPDKANFGSYGEASASHLAGELYKQSAGVAMTHVPYKGAAPAQTDLISGALALMFSDMSALPHIRAGRLRGLGVTGLQRSVVMPELPTVAESGVPGFDVGGWFALFVPEKTPEPITAQLRDALAKVVQGAALRQKIVDLGLEPSTTKTEAVLARQLAERQKWAKVIADANIKVD